MDKIDRIDAINRLSKNKLASLDEESRESYILDWWGIDDEDEEFSSLSADLQNLILSNDEPPSDWENCKYDELLMVALASDYRGVTNNFLSESMVRMELGEFEVCGNIEKLEACPCCGYRTLSSRGNYEICGLCGWEDNGIEDTDKYSGPNHMTLGEAQKKFKEKQEELPLGKWVKA